VGDIDPRGNVRVSVVKRFGEREARLFVIAAADARSSVAAKGAAFFRFKV